MLEPKDSIDIESTISLTNQSHFPAKHISCSRSIMTSNENILPRVRLSCVVLCCIVLCCHHILYCIVSYCIVLRCNYCIDLIASHRIACHTYVRCTHSVLTHCTHHSHQNPQSITKFQLVNHRFVIHLVIIWYIF